MGVFPVCCHGYWVAQIRCWSKALFRPSPVLSWAAFFFRMVDTAVEAAWSIARCVRYVDGYVIFVEGRYLFSSVD